jgi:predicted GNAT family N-acyltransferase
MTAIELRWVDGTDDLRGAIAVRERVFVEEQKVPLEEELDGRDVEALHLLALDGDEVVGTLRLLFDGDTVKVGRVAVDQEWRGQGIASEMLDVALARAVKEGSRRARLASQLEVVPLYERSGFAVESEVFEEAGIPHVWMSRDLTSGAPGATGRSS